MVPTDDVIDSVRIDHSEKYYKGDDGNQKGEIRERPAELHYGRPCGPPESRRKSSTTWVMSISTLALTRGNHSNECGDSEIGLNAPASVGRIPIISAELGDLRHGCVEAKDYGRGSA